jgi:hypothetical protein
MARQSEWAVQGLPEAALFRQLRGRRDVHLEVDDAAHLFAPLGMALGVALATSGSTPGAPPTCPAGGPRDIKIFIIITPMLFFGSRCHNGGQAGNRLAAAIAAATPPPMRPASGFTSGFEASRALRRCSSFFARFEASGPALEAASGGSWAGNATPMLANDTHAPPPPPHPHTSTPPSPPPFPPTVPPGDLEVGGLAAG